MAGRIEPVGREHRSVGSRVAIAAGVVVVVGAVVALAWARGGGQASDTGSRRLATVIPRSVLRSGVFEIDAATHRVVSRVSYALVAPGAANGFGARWIPSHRGVARVDPATGRITGQVRLPNAGYSVVVAGRSVWAADQGDSATVFQIDPISLRVVRRIFLPTQPYGNLYSGEGYVWETGTVALAQIDPRTGRVVAQIPVTPAQPLNNAYVVVFGAGSMWVIDEHAPEPGSSRFGVLYRIDPPTHRIIARIPIPSSSWITFFDLAYGDGTVWVADGQAGILRAVSPEADTVTQTTRVGYADSITVGNGSVWVVNQTTGLTQYTLTGHPRWHAILPAHPQSIGLDGPRVWISYGQDHPRGASS